MLIAPLIGIAPQVTDVLHEHKGVIKLFIVKSLAIRCIEDQGPARLRSRAIHYFEHHTRASFRRRLPVNPVQPVDQSRAKLVIDVLLSSFIVATWGVMSPLGIVGQRTST